MGIFDKARDALHQHADKVDTVVDRVADEADRRTGGRHGEHIDRAAEMAKERLGDQARRDTPTEPGPPA